MKAKEIRRKLYAIALVTCMVAMTTAPAKAAGKSSAAPATQPTRFTAPEILKDASGHTYDLGGMEIIVRDWWTGRYDQDQEKTEYDLAKEEYVNWLQETYNFKITRTAMSQWADAPQDFIDYASAPADDKNYVFMLRDDPTMVKAFKTGLCADLSKLSCLDFNEWKFQTNLTHEVYTYGDAVYAMYAGYSEPRTGVYFNKRLLLEAGVDPDSIYDMQANGTWTWDAFEQLCKKVARDTDNDGVIDVYACNANNILLIEQAVFSNGGNFISKDENGKFVNALKDEKSIEGLRFAQKVLDEYWQVEPDGVEWDYYKNAYLNGEYVFLIDQSYVGYNNLLPRYDDDGNIDPDYPGMDDPFGFVAFPKGPQATDYVNCWSNNFCCIPSNYDADRAWKIAFAWNLYTDEVPGYEDNEEWKAPYIGYDDRAINETLEMMRTKGTVTCVSEIPQIFLGLDLTWNIFPHGNNLDELIETNIKNWDYLVKRENGEVRFPEVKKDASGKTYDLGGMEIIVADWWSSTGRPEETTAVIARQDYLDWIQETYNFKISRQRICEWSDANETALNYVNAGGDDKNYLFYVHTDYTILDEMKAGKFYDLSTLDCLDFSKKKFQESNTHLRWSYEDEIYGMNADRIDSRGGVLFNVQLLCDAGISPNEIYDMQANGTWTWDKFEELCKKATKDVNNDGVIDVYGCEGYPTSIAEMAVYSNGGVYVGKDENGKFTYNVEDEATVEALEFTKKLVESDFWRPDPAGAEWDDYYDAFCDRKIAFMPGEYMSVYAPYWNYFGKGELGFVMFPKGPEGENYVDSPIETAVVIPSCYDADRAWKIAFAWDLFTDDTYDFDDSEEWKKELKDLADDRTLKETLSIPTEGVVSCQNLIPDIELGYNITWEIKKGGPSIAELIDGNHAKMENAVRVANGDAILMQDQDYGITNKSLTLYDNIAVEFKMPAAVPYDNYHDQYLVVRMNGKESVIYPTRKDDLLIFTMNVGPQMLGDEILVEPHAIDAQGKEVVGQRLRYSAKTYCMNILTKPAFEGSDYADLRKLCVDMLAYGDAAQIYAGYKTDALASADLTDAQRQQGTNPSAAMSFKTVKHKYYGTVSASAMLAEISSVALYLEGTVNIQFKITATDLDGLRVVVTDGANELGEYVPDPNDKDGNGRYCVNFDGLNAGQMKKTVYATVMKGNKKVSNTYRYSIESYVNSMLGKGGTNLDNLLRAMMRYGNSAAEYVQNHQQ